MTAGERVCGRGVPALPLCVNGPSASGATASLPQVHAPQARVEGPPFARAPDTHLEEKMQGAGYARVAGVDEAGRGPLAGPVVAAAVILPLPCPIAGIDDSKRLSQARRESLYDTICQHAVAVATGVVEAETIDRINILQAARLAMRQAVLSIHPAPDYVLVDAVTIPDLPCPQQAMIHGDQLCLSIAAASIIAKVTRDRIVEELDRQYPQYGFAAHKGYATRLHLAALARHGACPEHRRSFAPVRSVLEQGRLFNPHGLRPKTVGDDG